MKVSEFFETRGAESLLAKEMGVTRQTVSLWRTGKARPSVTSVIRMAKALETLGVSATPAEVLVEFHRNDEIDVVRG